MTTTKFTTLAEFKTLNRSTGRHFFDRDAMKFFNSRIESGLIGGRFFVTSEKMDEYAPRLYTIREAMDDGSVQDANGYQRYHSLEAARLAVRLLS